MGSKNVFLSLFFSWCFCLAATSQSTASGNVKSFEIEAPQLETTKKIWIYLPKEYKTSGKKYPVIYMHDAQNVFDTLTAFSGEWRVDEFLDSRPKPEVIVVAVEHGNDKRISELTPFPNEKYGGGGGADYTDFIRFTLKPHIDASYPTLPEAEHTTILGSSLGGLLSFYAALKYPEVFGNAGVFSPSFWFSEDIYNFVRESNLDPGTRFYLLVGSEEGEETVRDVLKMQQLLQEKKIPEKNLRLKIVEGGQHNENFWSAEFPGAFSWIFQ